MPEEKKDKGSERIMLTMSSKLKENLDKEASKLGVSTTQYIMTLIINDVRKNEKQLSISINLITK